MPSILYFPPAMAQIKVAEDPEIVERRISDAQIDPEHESDFIRLNHMVEILEAPAEHMDLVQEGKLEPNRKDSYAEIRVRHGLIMAVRDLHEAEDRI